jgi:hypothetical protein
MEDGMDQATYELMAELRGELKPRELRYDQLTTRQARLIAKAYPDMTDPWRFKYQVDDQDRVVGRVALEC